MKIKEMFPEVEKITPPPKFRKPRKKTNHFTTSENYRRYRLHRKVKDLDNVKLEVRAKTITLPVGFSLENYPSVQELVFRFRYFAPTIQNYPPRFLTINNTHNNGKHIQN